MGCLPQLTWAATHSVGVGPRARGGLEEASLTFLLTPRVDMAPRQNRTRTLPLRATGDSSVSHTRALTLGRSQTQGSHLGGAKVTPLTRAPAAGQPTPRPPPLGNICRWGEPPDGPSTMTFMPSPFLGRAHRSRNPKGALPLPIQRSIKPCRLLRCPRTLTPFLWSTAQVNLPENLIKRRLIPSFAPLS